MLEDIDIVRVGEIMLNPFLFGNILSHCFINAVDNYYYHIKYPITLRNG